MDKDAIEHRKKLHNIFTECVKNFRNLDHSNIISVRQLIDSVDNEACNTYKNDSIEEREYLVENPKDNYQIPVSVYIPKHRTPNTSIVIYIYGGGFMFFTRKTVKRPMADGAHHLNKIWVSIEYRQSPEHKYPSALDDCLTVVQWVYHYKAQLFNSCSNAKIGIAGDSSGGLLAARVAQRLRSLLSFQILIFPWLNLKFLSDTEKEQLGFPNSIIQEFFEIAINNYLTNPDQDNLREISPLLCEDLAGLPKCLIISGEVDYCLNDAKAYHQKLLDKGLNSKLHIVSGTIYGHPYLDYLEAFLELTNEISCFLKHY